MADTQKGFELLKFGERTKDGFARAYQFAINIRSPNDKKGDEEYYTTYCESMTLPQRMYDTKELEFSYGKPSIKIATQVRFNNWSVTFRDIPGLQLRTDMLEWQELIVNTTKGKMMYNTPKDYKSNDSTAKIKLSPSGGGDEKSLGMAIYRFYGLYPADVSSITFSHSDQSLVTFSVDFAYDFFTVDQQ